MAKGDYPQASGKLWGAFVEAVKALAAEEGVGLGTHRSIPNGG
ncbi:MAG: PaREP1 family protein [Candidatus Bathyarchaeia archaeon]